MRRYEGRRRRGAFALRELLIGSVIVGVIALFVETQMGAGHATWRGALCQSNARQVGVALFMYAADYDGKLPTNAGSFDGLVTSTRPYLRDDSRFTCPETSASDGRRKVGFRTPSRYAGLPIAAGWPDPYLEGRPAVPQDTILLYESYTDQDAQIAPSYRHNGGAVCLLFTGQTTWVQNLRPPK